MALLTKLTELAQKETASGFVRRVPGIYLLVRIPVSHALGFSTRVGSPSTLDLVKAMRNGDKNQTSGDFLLRVEKSDRNTWMSRISLGRAPNNDLVVRHDSVSKLHAHFFVRAGANGNSSHEELVLCDVGSANGTLINGRTVDEGEGQAATVAAGDRIFFGEVECDLLDAAALRSKLRRLGLQSDF
jgi:FHA domain